MTQKGAPRFNVDTLRDHAGTKAFARGEEYYRGGQVQILIIEAARVLAQVAGSEDYRTELKGRGKSINGHCSCRAFGDFGFCKHLVAVGLAANSAGDTDDSGGLSRIREHLRSKSVDVLADMIVKLAEQDLHLLRRLELAATATQADDATLEARLRKAIDAATRAARYIDYSSAKDWARGVEEALDAIEQLLSKERAGLVLKLARYALVRIERESGNVDDSDGHCGALLHRAEDMHLTAAMAARPEPVQLARDLFARELKDSYGVFYGSAPSYAEVLGEQGLAEYRRLAEAAWQTVAKGLRRSDEFSTDHDRLISILDFFAERDGDIDARIALRAKTLSSPYRYLTLAEFCLEHHREPEALRYAEEGLWTFEDGRPDRRLVVFTADLLAKAGRISDAENHLWRAFKKEPSLELYTRLRETGGDAARIRALQTLEQCCLGKGSWIGRADLIVEIHLREKALDEAWASLRRFGASIQLEEKLARATEKTHPAQAVQVYQTSVERLASGGGYAEAVKLITRMSKLRDRSEQAVYLTALKERHGRKRNFMKLLG